jgi:transcription antitermination factor NusG
MPILPAEPDLYPADLWAQDPLAAAPDSADLAAPRWWCLHTKPRQEKATARRLRRQRVAYYLPQIVREGRTPGGRKIRSTIPLFVGYLFLRGNDRDRVEALKGNTLVNVLEIPDQPGMDRDLRQIHQMLSSGLAVLPEPTHPVGTNVRITEGPLRGLQGIVVRRERGDKFVALVQFLGQGASVALQDWQVERIGDG